MTPLIPLGMVSIFPFMLFFVVSLWPCFFNDVNECKNAFFLYFFSAVLVSLVYSSIVNRIINIIINKHCIVSNIITGSIFYTVFILPSLVLSRTIVSRAGH